MTELRYGTPEDAGMCPERITLARERAEEWVKSGHTPALVVLAARRGVICLHEAFGVLRPDEDSPPLERDSIFPLMSITKVFTATAVMQLAEDGLLGINRPVVDYIPELCGEGTEEVLVHHLLTHTSGYRHDEVVQFMEKRAAERPQYPPHDETQHPIVNVFLTLVYPAPLWKPPGVIMCYSDWNYLLLGELVRRVSGRSLADFARERIFTPLGMTDACFVVPDSARSRVVKRPADATGTEATGALWQGINSRQLEETPYAWGGAFATANDLARFGQAFLNGGTYGGARILSSAAVHAMTRNQIPGISAEYFWEIEKKEASYGYSWIVESTEKWKYFAGSLQPLGTYCHPGHGGVIFWVDPEHEIVGVYCEVTLRVTESEEHLWNFDLFQNVITSAVDDG